MRILIFGGGELAARFEKAVFFQGMTGNHDVKTLSKWACNITNYQAVCHEVSAFKPDWIVCTAGLSDLTIGVNLEDVVDANLLGPMNVGTVAAAFKVPCILIASTAGIDPGQHIWYGPAKAGVINFVRAMANKGADIYAVSPGRMHTRMRDRDFPNEDIETRVSPGKVANVMIDIIEGRYSPGANVVVRKVGLDRIDIYEEVKPCLPSLL